MLDISLFIYTVLADESCMFPPLQFLYFLLSKFERKWECIKILKNTKKEYY